VNDGFRGTRRYRLLRRIGAGGMGEVFEAFDRTLHRRVALKLLKQTRADALPRFKTEFRALHDLEHPNLVSFGELVEEAGAWFFTMEYVDGVDFDEYVRPIRGGDADSRETLSLQVPGPASQAASVGRRAPRDLAFDEARLRAALAQLACGVAALHEVGKIHRDIKPSNIRVEPSGRVVLLDFGLVTDLDRSAHLTGADEMVGTPAFAAPEQCGGVVGTAADWYSVGTLLYLAMTGQLPFDGTAMEILAAKQHLEPLPPLRFVDGIPDDLNALCTDLLRRAPEARPSDQEVLARLGVDGAPRLHPRPAAQQSSGSSFVGRRDELDVLLRHLDGTRDDRSTTVYLTGESGVGKSALLRRFAEEACEGPGAVVLAARCYENELVPFKAIDGLFDAVVAHMRSLAAPEVAALVPTKAGGLAEMFPALRAVEAFAEAAPPGDAVRDPRELRRRTFRTARELLTRLAERAPLVLMIDDMQWADADSLALLHEIMRPPEAPALLLVLVTRELPGGEAAPPPSPSMPGPTDELVVRPLPGPEARELAVTLLRRYDGAHDLADAIADEAGGHPLFMDELARHVQQGGRRPEQLVLDDVLWERIEGLGAEARSILELAAVASEPLARGLAAQALDLDAGELARHTSLLRIAHLLRQSEARHPDSLEPYHDRVRAAILARLPADQRRELHRRLARAIESSHARDDERLSQHWLGAGDLHKAARYALAAAAQASSALAFERAAHLYRRALALGVPCTAQARATRILLGDALRNAGLGREAAVAYLDAAAASASPADQLELRRRAGEELLLSGHLDEGMAVLEAVLAAIGTRLPTTPRRALVSLLWHRLRLRLRGLGYHERNPDQIPREALSTVDVSAAIATGLSVVDNVRGADFQTRNLLVALRHGEPRRIARALAIEAGHSAISAGRTWPRTQRLLAAAAELAARLGDPYLAALHQVVSGMAALLAGRWRESLRLSDDAEAALRACTGVAWEMDSAQLFAVDSLWLLGRLRELARRAPVLLAEAHARGDLYATINLRTGSASLLPLLDDQPAEARRHIAEAMARWSRRGVHVQHNRELFALVHLDLYEGDGAGAYQRACRAWPEQQRAQLLRVHMMRYILEDLRARAALAMPGVDPARSRLVARAARALERGTMPWGAAAGAVLRAGLATQRGDRDGAIGHLRRAVLGYDASDMAMHAAAAAHRLATLLGDGILVRDTEARMRAEGILRVDRYAAMLVPMVGGG
jgi:serine/threonine protein kinase